MIPILFEENSTTFRSNGMGRLSDAVSCMVTEECNGAFELHMEYPQTGVLVDQLKNSRIIYAMSADNKSPQPFRIYRISKPLQGVIEVDAEHISYQMIHIPVMPYKTEGLQNAINLLYGFSAENLPFSIRKAGHFDTRMDDAFSVSQPTNLRSVLFGQEGSLLDTYGGEWEFDGFTATLYGTATAMDGRGSDHGVTIRYGKNLTDLNQEENIQNTYTGICPFWKGVVMKDDGTEEERIVTLTECVVHSDKAENYPYQRTKIVDFTSEYLEPPTEEQLRARAERYIRDNNIGMPSVSLKVSFVALHQTQEYADMVNIEHINLCDTVTVIFPALDISTKAKVVRTVFDTLQERYECIEIGSLTGNLGNSLMETASEAAATAVSQAKEVSDGAYATKGQLENLYTDVQTYLETVLGNGGGRVVLVTNADNKPVELLILVDGQIYRSTDTLFRWNQHGLQYTQNGYEGLYYSIIDRNGKLNAYRLDGVIIGTDSQWNLSTGEAFFAPAKLTLGGKTVPAIAEEKAAAAVSGAVSDTVPGMITDAIEDVVPDMIADAISNDDTKLPLSGGTLTGPLSAAKGFNILLNGSAEAAVDKGSGVSPRYYPAKWLFDTGRAAVDGDMFVIRIPGAGASRGVYMSVDNGDHYYPVVTSGTSGVSTTFGTSTMILVAFESTGSATSICALNGSDTTGTVTGGVWRTLNFYNSNTISSAYCSTAASTKSKAASCSGYALLPKSYLHVVIASSNTASAALTLNVNSKGAKPIYINGEPSSASNKSLPAGSYLVYYDGTNYYFRTDGKIPGIGEMAYLEAGTNIETIYLPTSLNEGIPGDYAAFTVSNGIIYTKENE